MQRLNISKGHAFILVYSVTSRQSLEELKPVWDVIREVKGHMDGVPIMLVANKTDDTENKELNSTDGEAQAKKWGCHFLETSAKNNTNVKELFQELLNMEKNKDMSLDFDKSGKKIGRGSAAKIKEKCNVM